MKTALLRLGRVYDPHDVIADETTPRTQYDSVAFKQLARGVDVEIDHDDGRVIGRVRELSIGNDIFRGKAVRWHLALVDADLPAWVKPGTGVSIGTVAAEKTEFGAVTLVRHALLTEISVLSHRMTPLNEGAKVLSVRPFEHHATSRAARTRADLDALPWEAGREARQSHAQERGLLYRPAIGAVIGATF